MPRTEGVGRRSVNLFDPQMAGVTKSMGAMPMMMSLVVYGCGFVEWWPENG